jgi:predicted nucleic acid-binding protein
LIGTVVLDTDVASFIFKDDSRVRLYRPHVHGKLWAISFQSVAEFEQWAILRHWGERRKKDLEEFLKSFVLITPDRKLCKLWAQVRAQAKLQGSPIETADAWVAATALRFDVPLVTHNRTHFNKVAGLVVISEA